MVWTAAMLSILLALGGAVLSVVLLSWPIWAAFLLYVALGSSSLIISTTLLFVIGPDRDA